MPAAHLAPPHPPRTAHLGIPPSKHPLRTPRPPISQYRHHRPSRNTTTYFGQHQPISQHLGTSPITEHHHHHIVTPPPPISEHHHCPSHTTTTCLAPPSPILQL